MYVLSSPSLCFTSYQDFILFYEDDMMGFVTCALTNWIFFFPGKIRHEGQEARGHDRRVVDWIRVFFGEFTIECRAEQSKAELT